MRVSLGLTGRGVLCALASAVLAMALPPTAAAPAPSPGEAPRIPFGERYRATQHGGIVRAANSAATCLTPAGTGVPSCAEARDGSAAGNNGDYEMTYVDVDDDPNTYNSSSAELRLPAGARVTYARLYWGGNLRVGEQKPPEDNGRVLIAEPGGRYKEVLADAVIGHRRTGVMDGYTASADVTGLVARSGGGSYTVGQLNVAKGRTPAGAWGGWTLVAAYVHPGEPLRHLVLMDGYEPMTPSRGALDITAEDLPMPRGASGAAGVVAYDGDRGRGGETLTAGTGASPAYRVRDAANPADDPMNSTITDHGRPAPHRLPAYANTLGYDSDVHGITPALAGGGDSLTLRFTTDDEGYQLGAVFLQVDARP
ncbi:hypothetical protein [Streptomyces sp. DH37]|uniref:hypothetical protein n=1 Tax=Streptomyces sp. DH37 TaxID=3040122 RepID=UPI0024412CC6|nr:hypothetical protein [Streptomyces sp. DH37]MDG9704678.1 hypothetical protein [Streptomyces sp. DH37]